jgi:hypothetical protein
LHLVTVQLFTLGLIFITPDVGPGGNAQSLFVRPAGGLEFCDANFAPTKKPAGNSLLAKGLKSQGTPLLPKNKTAGRSLLAKGLENQGTPF